MACRGVLFAIEDHDVAALLDAADHDAVVEYVVETIEERWDEAFLAETDKAWDAIHRSLTDGLLSAGSGVTPMSRCIVGGQILTTTDDYIVAFTPAAHVPAVADALDGVDRDQFRDGYDRIDADDYGREFISDEDFEYTWSYFERARDLWRRAADAHRSVIFAVDQ